MSIVCGTIVGSVEAKAEIKELYCNMFFLLTILCSETQIQTQKFSYQNNLAKLRIIFTKYKLFNNNLTLQHPTIIIYNHLQNRQKPLPVAFEGPKIGKKPAKIYKIIRLLFHPVFSAQ